MFRDEVNKNYWVDRVLNEISKTNNVEHFIISDCRHKNEAIETAAYFDQGKFNQIIENLPEDEWKAYQLEYYGQAVEDADMLPDSLFSNCESINCTTIKVVRNNCPKIEYGADHKSENDLNNFVFDWNIENNGTLDELYNKVDCMLEQIGVLKNDR